MSGVTAVLMLPKAMRKPRSRPPMSRVGRPANRQPQPLLLPPRRLVRFAFQERLSPVPVPRPQGLPHQEWCPPECHRAAHRRQRPVLLRGQVPEFLLGCPHGLVFRLEWRPRLGWLLVVYPRVFAPREWFGRANRLVRACRPICPVIYHQAPVHPELCHPAWLRQVVFRPAQDLRICRPVRCHRAPECRPPEPPRAGLSHNAHPAQFRPVCRLAQACRRLPLEDRYREGLVRPRACLRQAVHPDRCPRRLVSGPVAPVYPHPALPVQECYRLVCCRRDNHRDQVDRSQVLAECHRVADRPGLALCDHRLRRNHRTLVTQIWAISR
jgi:hypothetical protein